MSDDYEVGFRKPPKHRQFGASETGNRRSREGRPKGSRNLKTLLQDELKQMVTVNDGTGPRRISKQKALVTGLVNRALKGDDKALGKLIDLGFRLDIFADDIAAAAGVPLSREEKEVLENLEARIRRNASQAAKSRKSKGEPS